MATGGTAGSSPFKELTIASVKIANGKPKRFRSTSPTPVSTTPPTKRHATKRAARRHATPCAAHATVRQYHTQHCIVADPFAHCTTQSSLSATPRHAACTGPFCTASEPCYEVTCSEGFDCPNDHSIEGVYCIQSSAHNRKDHWQKPDGSMHLRWASMWTQWIFDDELLDITSVAWIDSDLSSLSPEVHQVVALRFCPS